MSRELREPLLDEEAPPSKGDVAPRTEQEEVEQEATPGLEDREYKGTLCLIRGLYFLSGVSNVSWGRFAAVFYVSIGLDAFQIGILEGVMPVTASVCQPFWGYLSDKTRNRKRVFLITKVVASLILLLQAVPLFVDVGFPAILAISIGMSMFSAPGVLDAYALDVLGKSSGDYGTLRLWCALSWGLGSTLMGVVTDLMDGDFTYNFAIYAVFAFVGTGLIAWKVPNKSKSEQEVKSSDLHVKQLVQAACARNTIFFWGLATVFGICIAVVERLLFVFLQTELNASTTLCGGTVGVSVLFELPVFYWGKRILRWAGHDLMFLTAMVAYIVRVTGYTYLTSENVLFILPLEALHGLTFATMWTAAVDKARSIAPEGWLTSFQMLLSACVVSIGTAIGAPIGGWVMQHYGAKFMYQCAAFLMFGALIVQCLQLAVHRCHSSRQT